MKRSRGSVAKLTDPPTYKGGHVGLAVDPQEFESSGVGVDLVAKEYLHPAQREAANVLRCGSDCHGRANPIDLARFFQNDGLRVNVHVLQRLDGKIVIVAGGGD